MKTVKHQRDRRKEGETQGGVTGNRYHLCPMLFRLNTYNATPNTSDVSISSTRNSSVMLSTNVATDANQDGGSEETEAVDVVWGKTLSSAGSRKRTDERFAGTVLDNESGIKRCQVNPPASIPFSNRLIS